jgi:hypothetical protein
MMKISMRFWAVALVALVLMTGLARVNTVAAQDTPVSKPATELDPDILMKWMTLLYDRVEAEAVDAPAASRLYGYAGVTAYQSVMPGIPGAISMSGQLTDLGDMPQIEQDKEYDWISTANGALSTVIAGLFTSKQADTQRAIANLRSNEQKSREGEISKDIVKRSMAYGDEVGKTILDWISKDHYSEIYDESYELPKGDDSMWVLTEGAKKAVEPYWGQIRPFALYSADACAVKHNMPFSTDKNSAFYAQALEVKTTGDKLTPEQKDIARFWIDTPGQTGAPAGHWVMIENQVIDRVGLKLDRASMMYGLVGVALGDAFIGTWSLKYQINLVRPVTYINKFIDPKWKPFLQTPGFPEYPSGHSVASAAAAEVLTGMFGQVSFTDQSVRKHGMQPRSFTSFEAAASEAAISRLYGGIHYREAIENGMRMGRCIGQNVLNYVVLRSVPQGE